VSGHNWYLDQEMAGLVMWIPVGVGLLALVNLGRYLTEREVNDPR
jgi:hypothetical protein